MKKLFWLLLLAPCFAWASGGDLKPIPARVDLYDKASLQRGAHTFVNYCLNCHSANYMRYNRFQEIGLSEAQVKKYLLFTGDKVGDSLNVAMNKKDAKLWFGVAPPDLSVVARSRGADWLNSYMRGFYRDPATTTGWNNLYYPNVAMPHVLHHLQGEAVLKETHTESHGTKVSQKEIVLEKQGTLPAHEYEKVVSDLVNFLVFMGEPAKTKREQLGIIVLFILAGLLLLTYLLKKEYWKDVH